MKKNIKSAWAYRLLRACHHGHGQLQTLSTQGQSQGKCMHYLPAAQLSQDQDQTALYVNKIFNEIIKSLVITCPGVKVLPSNSTGGNGLPLAKIARPYKAQSSQPVNSTP